MVTRYVSLSSNFNLQAWSRAIERETSEHGQEFVARYLGISPKTVQNWINLPETAYRDFPYPHMTNFLNFCNAFGYDPRDFFMVGD